MCEFRAWLWVPLLLAVYLLSAQRALCSDTKERICTLFEEIAPCPDKYNPYETEAGCMDGGCCWFTSADPACFYPKFRGEVATVSVTTEQTTGRTPITAGKPQIQDTTIWEENRDLFIVIIVLVCLCLIIILFALSCMKFRRRAKDRGNTEDDCRQRNVQLTTIENAMIPSEEIASTEVQMVEHDNTAYTPNGSGQHISKNEANGWIVPMSELTPEERKQPEMQNTNL